MSWQALEDGNKELAEFGRERFASQVAYLATIRKDGSPRVHPVTPIVGEGHLFLFMEPTSPKGHDLRRDSRYALHASVEDQTGGNGEFFITGQARFSDDPNTRAIAAKHASYPPAERYILFELDIVSAFSNVYVADGASIRQQWKQG